MTGIDRPDVRGRGRTYRIRRAQLRHPWRNLVIAVVLSYGAFFAYGAGLADSSSGGSEAEGGLVLTSCEPNWLVLGVRSRCSGTITPGPNHLRTGEQVSYEISFSRFGSSDVGRSIPMHDADIESTDSGWQPTAKAEAPFLAQLLIGPLALVAVGFWYITIVGAIASTFRKGRGAETA